MSGTPGLSVWQGARSCLKGWLDSYVSPRRFFGIPGALPPALALAIGWQNAASAAETFATPPAAIPFVPPAPASAPLAPPESGSILPSLPNVDFTWSGYFQALAILCFILALILAVLWLIKKRGSNGFFNSAAPLMRIESRLALGPKKWLMAVRCQDRHLVLGVTEKSITLLTELYDQDFSGGGQATDVRDDANRLWAKSSKSGQLRGKDKNRQEDAQNEDDDMFLSFASALKNSGQGQSR